MILVTIGTNEQPFDRLVRAAAALDLPEPLVVQHGSSRVPHGRGEWVDFISFEELSSRMRQARVVVCHAGVGSIMLARRCGKHRSSSRAVFISVRRWTTTSCQSPVASTRTES